MLTKKTDDTESEQTNLKLTSLQSKMSKMLTFGQWPWNSPELTNYAGILSETLLVIVLTSLIILVVFFTNDDDDEWLITMIEMILNWKSKALRKSKQQSCGIFSFGESKGTTSSSPQHQDQSSSSSLLLTLLI